MRALEQSGKLYTLQRLSSIVHLNFLCRCLGIKTDFSKQPLIGIELSKWSPNGNKGSINNEQYFECKSGYGYFVELMHIKKKHDPNTKKMRYRWFNPKTWKGPRATRKRKVFGRKMMTLYHVTDEKSADIIFKQRKMMPGTTGMFGGGIYFAETVRDAQYKAKHQGVLITARVHVGKEHVVNDAKAGHFSFQDLQKVQ